MNDNTAQPTPTVSSNANDQFSNAMNSAPPNPSSVKQPPASYVDDYQPPKSLGAQPVAQVVPTVSSEKPESKNDELEETLKTLRELLEKKDVTSSKVNEKKDELDRVFNDILDSKQKNAVSSDKEIVKPNENDANQEAELDKLLEELKALSSDKKSEDSSKDNNQQETVKDVVASIDKLDNDKEVKTDDEILKLEDSDELLLDSKSVDESEDELDKVMTVNESNEVVEDESLETQNIFEMLGADDGDDELKESFLDELQDTVWDNFLNNDVSSLFTTVEMVEFDKLKDKRDSIDRSDKDAYLQAQDSLVSYIESLVPDLENLMLAKALELKKDLFFERITATRESNADNQEILIQLSKVEELAKSEKYRSATTLLNSLKL